MAAAGGETIFNDTSTAGHATITNQAAIVLTLIPGGATIFNGFIDCRQRNPYRQWRDDGVGAVRFFLMVLRRVAPRGWRFLTMVTWTLAATNRV